MTDLISGQVSMMIDTVPFNLAHVRAGTLRALAVAADKRSAVLPDVPTMAEVGLPDVQGGLWLALFAPANTPPAVIAYLNKQAREIFALPDVRGADGAARPGAAEGLAGRSRAFLAAEERAGATSSSGPRSNSRTDLPLVTDPDWSQPAFGGTN